MTAERARVLLVRDDRIALIERHRFGEQYYVTPGGEVEDGETVEQAAVREGTEELGLDVRPLRKVFVLDGTAIGRGRHHYFLCESDGTEFGPMTGPETAAADNVYNRLWVPLADVHRLQLRPERLRRLLAAVPATGWPPTPLTLRVDGD